MASQIDASRRASRLRGLFKGIISGNRPVTNATVAKQFFEAIQDQKPPSACAEAIVGSKSGRDAVRYAVRVDLTAPFVLAFTLPFLRYLSDPGIKALAGGQLLQDILLLVSQPPIVWNTLNKLFYENGLDQEALRSFAWLALELVSLPSDADIDVLPDVRAIVEHGALLNSECHETRQLMYKAKNVLRIRDSPKGEEILEDGPGGRHDNDHANFRDIRTYPTTDEFLSTQTPFYRTIQDVFNTDLADRPRVHLDNQYRLLREDMLAEMREDIHLATGKKKGKGKRKNRALTLGCLVPVKIELEIGGGGKLTKCCLAVECYQGLQFLKPMSNNDRKKYLKKEINVLKHQSFGVLCRGDELYGFAFICRDEDDLAKDPPVVRLQFTEADGLRRALLVLKSNIKVAQEVRFIFVDTPVFAYEPVLHGLKNLHDLPLQDLLLNPRDVSLQTDTHSMWPEIVSQLQKVQSNDDGSFTLPPRAGHGEVRIDGAQYESLITAFTSPVCLIQGPPGTGKSFIGAQVARHIYEHSRHRILVLSYTNHALDQFLEDLLHVGIPNSEMVRIGNKAKCTPATVPFVLSQIKDSYRRSRDTWAIINSLKDDAQEAATTITSEFSQYRRFNFSWTTVSEYLEFEDTAFYEALHVPENNDGWRHTGKRGKQVGPDYLYQRWRSGIDAGIFKATIPQEMSEIWLMPPRVRQGHIQRWEKTMIEEHLGRIGKLADEYNRTVDQIDRHYQERDVSILTGRRVIGCTTTAAAKYSHLIRSARPDVILVEEAGEILESHILTAMSPTVKQMTLIGDHKQLRPKVNNWSLTVEKGDGFDLNRSLFERMIMQGAPYTTLSKQHRMVPEISIFARRMTYPELLDDPKTLSRPMIRGLQDRVVFLNHEKQEDLDNELRDRRDPSMKESKKNTFEAEMVLCCLRYFGQQGYGSENIVILTPYLGQLRAIRDLLLHNQHNPEFSELDRHELIRAGLMTQAASKVDRKPVRVSTIDNYQGEESDIVIASLTRSNENGDIGFMAAPERLNVLITRARNCLVLIGNMETFKQSKKGVDAWQPFFQLLKEEKHLYDGLPVKCERHPERKALLKNPVDFNTCAPDGGCTEPCNAPLKCRAHKCRSRCHRISDHSKIECNQLVDKTCNRQHKSRVLCGRQTEGCKECAREDIEIERRARRDMNLELERAEREAAYNKQREQLEDEIDVQKRRLKYAVDEEEQKKTLAQKRADLENLKDTHARMQESKKKKQENDKKREAMKNAAPKGNPAVKIPDDLNTAKGRWDYLKKFEGAKNDALDGLMDMIGLEEVKEEFMSIKSKIDTSLRQGVSLGSERFSCSLLGNPGTGKTTVARIYARFLTSVGVIPGAGFEETTGSNLANKGVSGCKQMVEDMLNNGGGVIFIDEAYQLTSGNSPGGKGVLDYLLAEVENLTGKIVFVLAGYSRQMESFFSHNPGLPSRFPIEMKFADYTDAELLEILELKTNKKYNHSMRCEDGLRGLYCRIVVRRIGRGRGKEGFGNARAVENVLSIITKRQANRLQNQRFAGLKPDDLLLTREDLIGPKPADALTNCPAWGKLQKLFGLGAVKQAVQALVDSIQQNYQRELDEASLIEYSLNKVFLGNPGTGKTTVAKLYGEILVALGLLSKGEVIIKNPSDFVGAAMGQSEQQTKGILAAAVGKVLVIDEAYGLYRGGNGTGSVSDPYRTAVIDTIVAEVQSVPGDDRCVLLLGYQEQLETMFQNVNPGLSRRFPVASGFVFEDFSDDDLGKILDLKLKQAGYRVTGEARGTAMEMLQRARNRPNFGNAGEIDIILDATKARHQTRITKEKVTPNDVLQARDFDPDFDRAERADTNVRKLFEGTVGGEETIRLLEGYQETVRTMKSLQMDPKESIPFNFLFRGPPGTGKTTTAKKMGKVFYDMGFLAKAEVVECSASDLMGQYVGQTGPKVRQLLDTALGRVLFIDEAYRLSDGHYAKEAIDELVDSVTKDRYFKKLIIILAGYENDINKLMSVNPGLTSRFPEVINFRSLNPKECLDLMLGQLRGQRTQLTERGLELDLSSLESPKEAFRQAVVGLFSKLAQQANWASARDVKTIAQNVFKKALMVKEDMSRGRFVIRESSVEGELQAMLSERGSRGRQEEVSLRDLRNLLAKDQPQPQPQMPKLPTRPAMHPRAETCVAEQKVEEEEAKPDESEPTEDGRGQQATGAIRDAGVSDEVWEQLQQDKKVQEEREEEYKKLKEAANKATSDARDKIVAKLLEEEKQRRKREKLQYSGLCPVGYHWIQQQGGYRCAGGSHFLSDAALDQLGL